MKRVIGNILKALMIALLVVIVCGGIYGCYMVAKNVSYSLFYSTMVEKTILENVKPECLIKE